MTLKYSIGAIGWYNFERLVQTLLKAVIGPGVTSFGGTKDGGRDATYDGAAPFPSEHTQWDGYWVFQAKHVDLETQGAKGARDALLKAFEKECKTILARREQQRQADNYVLVTDVPLTAGNRAKLGELARDAGVEGNFHVVDGEEVCQFLDVHPQIRRSYPQLLGLADLDRIFNREVYQRSEAYVEQWQPRLATFVRTRPYDEALSTLAEHRFVVLDGPPEAGKSTIAAAVAMSHAAEGFEIVDVRSPDDIFQQYRPEQAQLFVADDALGSISFDPRLTDRWSRDLAGVKHKLDSKHVLVWTARTYILQEAIDESRLGDTVGGFPAAHEVVVEVDRLTLLEKAQILYNHAKRSPISDASRALIRKRARSIAEHPDFTPERIRQLIEHFLPQTAKHGSPVALSVSWDEVSEFLRNPGTRWIKAYRKLGESERILLVAMLDFGGRVARGELRRAYEARCRALSHSGLRFDTCTRRVEHSFVRVTSTYAGQKLVDFQHPSIRDMLLSHLTDDEVARRKYLQLASPSGLAAVIQGLAPTAQGQAGNGHHLLVSTEEELRILRHRLSELSGAVLRFDEWHRLLLAADLLIPRTASKMRIAPAEIDLKAFGNTSQGEVVAAIVRGFGSESTFQHHRSYDLGNWTVLLRVFYGLAPYLVPPPRPDYLPSLLECLGSAATEDAIRLATLIARFEPLLISQCVSKDLLDSWDTWIRFELEGLIELGKEFPEDWTDYYAEDVDYEDVDCLEWI